MRPRAKIDPDMVEKLAAIQCSQQEIATVVGCSVDTLQRRFRAQMESGKERGKVSIRRKQYEVAMKGDKAMLIWLGKQWLGQTDQREIRTDGLKVQIEWERSDTGAAEGAAPGTA